MAKKRTGKSKLATEIVKYADAMFHGTCLSIDPSSGSAGSLPGYAVFKRGELIDYGVVSIPPGTRSVYNRLYLLHKALFEGFTQPDILLVEHIATGMGNYAVGKALVQSVGAIISVWDVPTVEVSPATWRARINKETYVKSDAQDAVTLYCAARQVLEEELGGFELYPMIDIQAVKNL